MNAAHKYAEACVASFFAMLIGLAFPTTKAYSQELPGASNQREVRVAEIDDAMGPYSWLSEQIPDIYGTDESMEESHFTDKGRWGVLKYSYKRAVQLLEDATCVKLDSKEAFDLAGIEINIPKNHSLYLVRAVKPAEAVTEFDTPSNPNVVFRIWHSNDNSAIGIINVYVGKEVPRFVKYPIILLLPREPDMIFVRSVGFQ